MKQLAAFLIALSLLGCTPDEKPLPTSEAGEKLYTLRGVILSRNPEQKSLRVDHEAIPDFMPAMVMDYTVRGAGMATLPADKARIEARLHVTSRGYWLTDVKKIP
jgi:hypothetical protein